MIRLLYITLTIGICILLPHGIVLYGSIWILGWISYILPGIAIKGRYARIMLSIVATVILALSLFDDILIYHSPYRNGYVGDLVTGLATALWLYTIRSTCNQRVSENHVVMSTGKLLSGFAYTLYLTHWPLLQFLKGILHGRLLSPTLAGTTVYLVFCLVFSIYAFVISRVTEAKTDAMRQLVSDMLQAITSRVNLGA